MNNNDSNKKCPVCGADVFDNNHKFCYKCGYKFESVKHNQLFDFSIVNDVKNKLKETSDEVKKNIGIESKPKEEKKEETKELKEEKTKKSKFSFFNMNESKKDYMGEYLNGLSEQVSKSTRNNFIKDYPISYDEKDMYDFLVYIKNTYYKINTTGIDKDIYNSLYEKEDKIREYVNGIYYDDPEDYSNTYYEILSVLNDLSKIRKEITKKGEAKKKEREEKVGKKAKKSNKKKKIDWKEIIGYIVIHIFIIGLIVGLFYVIFTKGNFILKLLAIFSMPFIPFIIFEIHDN